MNWRTTGLALMAGIMIAIPALAPAYGDGTPDEQPPYRPRCRGVRYYRALLHDRAGQQCVRGDRVSVSTVRVLLKSMASAWRSAAALAPDRRSRSGRIHSFSEER